MQYCGTLTHADTGLEVDLPQPVTYAQLAATLTGRWHLDDGQRVIELNLSPSASAGTPGGRGGSQVEEALRASLVTLEQDLSRTHRDHAERERRLRQDLQDERDERADDVRSLNADILRLTRERSELECRHLEEVARLKREITELETGEKDTIGQLLKLSENGRTLIAGFMKGLHGDDRDETAAARPPAQAAPRPTVATATPPELTEPSAYSGDGHGRSSAAPPQVAPARPRAAEPSTPAAPPAANVAGTDPLPSEEDPMTTLQDFAAEQIIGLLHLEYSGMDAETMTGTINRVYGIINQAGTLTDTEWIPVICAVARDAAATGTDPRVLAAALEVVYNAIVARFGALVNMYSAQQMTAMLAGSLAENEQRLLTEAIQLLKTGGDI